MNKIKKLAKEQFGGDQLKALNYMIETFDAKLLDEYLMECTLRQTGMFFDLALCKATLEEKDPTNAEDEEYSYSYFLDNRNRNAPNPYGAKVKRCLIGIIIIHIISGCLQVGMPAEYLGTINMITIILSGYISLYAALQIISYFDYRKKKKVFELCVEEIRKEET